MNKYVAKVFLSSQESSPADKKFVKRPYEVNKHREIPEKCFSRHSCFKKRCKFINGVR